MIWSLSFDPLVPIWALALAGAVAAVLAAAAMLMRLPAWPLRGLAMALVGAKRRLVVRRTASGLS